MAVLTAHRCGCFMHGNLAQAAACHRRRTDQAEAEAIAAYRLSPVERAHTSFEAPLPATVESACGILDRASHLLIGIAAALTVATAGIVIWRLQGT